MGNYNLDEIINQMEAYAKDKTSAGMTKEDILKALHETITQGFSRVYYDLEV